jgi:release factor glutamine methyltransferase
VENGRLDAELLLSSVLGVRRLDLYLQHDRPLRQEELAAFKVLLKRRADREPLQYVLGRTSFRELELKTDPRALIPRPETEILVGEVLTWAEGRQSLIGLDLGTGTGAIALSLLREGPFRSLVATDPSTDALELARENAETAGLAHRVDLRCGALFDPLGSSERFHLIVSNPPYVAEGEKDTLQVEVRGWEPPEALFAGLEGLDLLIPIVQGAPGFLEKGGLLALEVGADQTERVSAAMVETGVLEDIRCVEDLAGRGRVVLGVASR